MALEMLPGAAGQLGPQAAPPAAPVEQAPDPIQVSMEEAKKNRAMLDASIQRMRESLENRTKAPFDPMLMRIAAEAGKPTKTGSFYESIGNVAGGMLEQNAADQKLRQENELKLEELIQKGALLRNKQLAMEAANRMVGGVGSEVGSEVGGKTGASAPGRFITDQDIQRITMIDPEAGKALRELGEYQLKFIKETKDGIYDIRRPNQPIVRFEQPAVDTNLPYIGAVKVPPSVRDRVYAVRDQGREQGWDIKRYKAELAKIYAEEGIGGEQLAGASDIVMGTPKTVAPTSVAGATAPVGGAPSAGGPTLLSQQTAEKTKEFLKGDTAEDVKNRAEVGADLYKPYKEAPAMKRLAGQNIQMANSDAGKKVLGAIAGSPKLADRFFDMLASGVRTPAGTLEIPGINDFVTLLGATPEQVNTYKMIVQNAAEASLLFRRMYLVGQGQGTVTEGEQAMASRLAPTERDTPTTFAFKSHVLEKRAILDQKRYEAFEQWKKNPANAEKSGREFMTSPENKRLEANYDKWLDHTFHNFFGDPLMPRSHSGKPGQRMGNLESQIR